MAATLPTPPRAPDTLPILTATDVQAFTESWQLKPPRDATIVIVKRTFDLVPDAPARPAEEQLLPNDEVVFDDAESPDCVRYPGDTAFFKPRADVFLVGRAYPPPAMPRVGLVRFAVGSALDFSLAVVGTRRWRGGVPTEPESFESIELRPDLAYGGEGHKENPIGRGYPAVNGALLPHLDDANHVIRSSSERPRPVFTTPRPKTSPSRMKLTGSYGGRWAKDRAPYFPDDFDWAYFNAAPRELQVPYLRGDEKYWIKGMVRGAGMLHGQLPGVRVRALAQPVATPSELRELPMNLDTAWFDAEANQVVLVWRGAIETEDRWGSDLASILVVEDPVNRSASPEALRARFLEYYERDYGSPLSEPEPEPEPEPQPPEGYVAPRGLDPARARALGLPPWAATIEGEAPPEPPPRAPPPPRPAATSEELDSLLSKGGSLAGADLSGCDLSRRNLSGRDLSGANLTGVDLRGSMLEGCVLSGAILAEANAEEVDLSSLDLSGADLTGAILSGAVLDGATLEGAVLDRARAIGARFEGAKMKRVSAFEADLSLCRFDGADLSEADLTGAKLIDASMRGCTMPDVRLYSVEGRGLVADDAEMERCRADGADLTGASFQRVEAMESSLRETDLSRADFRRAKLEKSVFDDCNLERAIFSQVEAKSCRWSRARAKGASFLKADLMEGHFDDAVFEGADMRGANLYDSSTFQASFRGANLTHAILGNTGLG